MFKPPMTGAWGQPLVSPSMKMTVVPPDNPWADSAADSIVGAVNPTDVIDADDYGTAVPEGGEVAPDNPTADADNPWQDAAADAITGAQGGETDLSGAAEQIVNGYGSEIRQFVNAQRMNYNAGIVPIHKRMASFPGLDVHYMNQQGREDIHYVVYPENAPAGMQIPLLIDIDGIAVEFFPGSG